MAKPAKYLSALLCRAVADNTGIIGECDLQLTLTPELPFWAPPAKNILKSGPDSPIRNMSWKLVLDLVQCQTHPRNAERTG
jgi:hypothetical protein